MPHERAVEVPGPGLVGVHHPEDRGQDGAAAGGRAGDHLRGGVEIVDIVDIIDSVDTVLASLLPPPSFSM